MSEEATQTEEMTFDSVFARLDELQPGVDQARADLEAAQAKLDGAHSRYQHTMFVATRQLYEQRNESPVRYAALAQGFPMSSRFMRHVAAFNLHWNVVRSSSEDGLALVHIGPHGSFLSLEHALVEVPSSNALPINKNREVLAVVRPGAPEVARDGVLTFPYADARQILRSRDGFVFERPEFMYFALSPKKVHSGVSDEDRYRITQGTEEPRQQCLVHANPEALFAQIGKDQTYRMLAAGLRE